MFGEKAKEYNGKTGQEIPVWKSPKYQEAREKAVSLLDKGMYDLTENDFWIQKNLTKSGDKMVYTGLIISHNGCLKINDRLEKRFRSECVTVDKEGYANSLVFTYNCPEQGLFEAGEVNRDNCKIAYPYAMALKRLFDRVVLKLCKLAYSGIYADTESDEFEEDTEEKIQREEQEAETLKKITLEPPFCPLCGKEVKPIKKKDGTVIPAQQVLETYGMCASCVKEQAAP